MWKFIRNKEGNIAMTFGIALMPIILSVGAAVDYSNTERLKSKMANSVDAGLLAAAALVVETVDLDNKSAVETAARTQFMAYASANYPGIRGTRYRAHNLSYNPDTKELSAKLNFDYSTFVLRIIGKPTISVEVIAKTKIQLKAGGAISMFLVLDKSGSMSLSGRMTTLKVAVNSLTTQFETADPTHQYVRMGAVAYDKRARTRERLGWGSTRTNRFVQRLRAHGDTNSTNAVRIADRELNNSRENREHNNRSGQVPEKIMVFMTDGANNRRRWDRATIRNCNIAKRHQIEIYTVAFQAPSRGRTLLRRCASDNAHYFEASNASELIQAFNKIGASVGEKLILTQ